MNKNTLILLLILLTSCGGKNTVKSVDSKKENPVPPIEELPLKDTIKPKGGTIELGYSEGLPQLKFDTVSEQEFNKYNSKKFLSKPKLEQKGNNFFVTTEIRKHSFKKYKDYGGEKSWSGFEFFGYYSNLGLYAITENSSSEGLGFGELFLLDSKTDFIYRFLSIGDGAVELPIPSPKNTYLVYYYNSVYEHQNCDIVVLKVDKEAKPEKLLKEHASLHSDDFAVEKIVWASETTFYVKGYQEVYENEEWVKKYSYYRTRFKK